MTTHILIIEDDREFSRVMQIELRQNGYETTLAHDGLDGLRQFHLVKPNLVILDVALPLMDGRTVCHRIREVSDIPVLMMTASAVTEDDIVAGLNAGADEYLVKPLRSQEFRARVRALLRRARPMDDDKEPLRGYEDEYLMVDVPLRRVSVNGDDVRLTPTEFKLLVLLIQHSGQVLTFQQLLENVWGVEYTREYHYPRIYVSHLRRKIEPDVKSPTYIQSEYGIGYRFVKRTA